jgi:hypothetical protein
MGTCYNGLRLNRITANASFDRRECFVLARSNQRSLLIHDDPHVECLILIELKENL